MSEAKKKADGVEIVLVGPQHGGQPGEKRTVTKEVAADMVAVGTARYPE